MNIVLCDDEIRTIHFLEKLIFDHYGERHTVTSFSNASALLDYDGQADLLVTDIKLGEMNGIAQAILFSEKHPKVKVIFISGYPSEFYEDIFNGIHPYAFLGKPIREERLYMHIDNIQRSLDCRQPFHFMYKGTPTSVSMADIKYIESHGRQKFLYTDHKTYIINQSFEQLQEQLSAVFVRCHSAFIVNMNYISNCTSTNLVMGNGSVIPIGRKYKTDFQSKFLQFMESDI
ncbi:MAG: LytTR family DNA-binding domain-containing protein [Oscillospiraceae bacterium]|nr:LytTR family DNA-binding domain-containing protein [Oscillospiraceae bacterium]